MSHAWFLNYLIQASYRGYLSRGLLKRATVTKEEASHTAEAQLKAVEMRQLQVTATKLKLLNIKRRKLMLPGP